MRTTTLAIALTLGLVSIAEGQAQNHDRYAELRYEVEACWMVIETATEAELPALRELCTSASHNTLTWLTDFMNSAEYDALQSITQEMVVTDVFREEYSLASLLLQSEHCSEVVKRLRLFDWRPSGQETYEAPGGTGAREESKFSVCVPRGVGGHHAG